MRAAAAGRAGEPTAPCVGPRALAGEDATHVGHQPATRTVRIDDATGRAILVACDGTHDRAALARAASLTSARRARRRRHVLERYALAGLFEA